MNVVATRELVDIVTRKPIDKDKSLFQHVTTTVLQGTKVPASLSSIYVPSKKLPVTTYYTIPIVEIFGPDFRGFTFGGVDMYENLEKSASIWIRLDIPIFQEQVRYLLWIFTSYNFHS